jgi:hypothetical protein
LLGFCWSIAAPAKKVIFPAPLLNSDIVGDAPILVQTGNSEISP